MIARPFRSAAALRTWLTRHHARATELWVLFYKKGSGRGGLAYREAVEQALCFGWIDGLTQRVDEESYRQRFTPRTQRSHWSAVNVRRFAILKAAGQVTPAGQRAFDAWDGRAAPYSGEHRDTTLAPHLLARFEADVAAWRWFVRAPAGYQRTAAFWVMSAKREDTRARRLAILMADSAEGRRVAPLRSSSETAARRDRAARAASAAAMREASARTARKK